MMKIVIAGGTGFIGSALCNRLGELGHSLVIISSRPAPAQLPRNREWAMWSPGQHGPWEQAVDDADVVINLAGEPIPAKRWTAAQKEKIRSSRINTTRALVVAMGKVKERASLLINASAIGYYGPRGDEAVVEETEPGNDFVSRVCVEWEKEAQKAESLGVRVVCLRTGIVLGKGGGALAKMVLPFKLFGGGPIGSGRQWVSWIQLEDEVELIVHLLQKEKASGAVNATAPNPVTMKVLCQTLGQVLHRPSWAPVPAFALRLLMGEIADMVVTGQRVLPAKAQRLGYTFRYPDLTEALRVSVN
ncbi:MAG: TIGR01777 family oxidoreductase [Candidatus Binatia bacterium]